jgi:hypothetical protein
MDGLPTQGGASSSTQVSASLPSMLSDGDWIGCIYTVSAVSTLTPPAQYSLVPNTLQTSSQVTTGVFYHIWHIGDPTTGLIFQSSVTGNMSYICAAYRGVNQVSPFDDSSSQFNSTNSTTATSPSINGQANDLLLMLYGVRGLHTFSNQSEGTIEATQGSGPSDGWVDFQLTTSGPTGAQTVMVNSSNASNGVQIALVPAGP